MATLRLTKTKVVPTKAEGNPAYPLPVDYDSLTSEGQRAARVNAARQWTLWENDREMRAYAFVRCIHFFDHYYLRKTIVDGEIEFDPMFYDYAMPTPPFHWAWDEACIRYRKTAMVGPRGGAKSFRHARRMIMQMVTQPMYQFTYATASDDLTKEMGDRVKYQCYYNERIHMDYADEYGGKIKPGRSEARTGMEAFKLSNRAGGFFTSAQSRQRGQRPNVYILDDPEYDPRKTTPMDVLREGMHQLLFEVALPMVQKPGTSLTWTGTYVSLRHYLWHAMQTKEIYVDGKARVVSDEPKFGSWYRIVTPAAEEVDGKLVSCWPNMWPANDAQKESLGLPEDTQTLLDVETDLGPEVFRKEMMADPTGVAGSYWPNLTKELHGYWFKDGDEHLTEHRPHLSLASICWMRDGKTIEMTLRDFCDQFRRFETCDSAFSEGSDSDYKVNCIMAVTDHNELMVLDLWASNSEPRSVQVQNAFVLADTWLASSIHPENVQRSKVFCDDLIEVVKMKSREIAGVEHLAHVIPFHPGLVDKGTRIDGALTTRMIHGLVKLPWEQRHIDPWRMAFAQFEGFDPRMADCGLKNDDIIDVVSMSREAIPGLPKPRLEDVKLADPIELMKKGIVNDADGQPLFFKCLHRLTRKDMDEIMMAMTPVINGSEKRESIV